MSAFAENKVLEFLFNPYCETSASNSQLATSFSLCARNVERSDGAMLSAQEAMKHVGCVNIVSRDVPRRVQVLRGRALAGACARAETSNVVNVPSVARTNP